MPTLEDLGYNDELERFRQEQGILLERTGRIVAEHRERYSVVTGEGTFDAEITGNLRYAAATGEEFPAVGDWVEIIPFEHNFAIIPRIFPRSTVLRRGAAGQTGEIQVIAANIDLAFIVQSLDRDHNLNRLERYLVLCHSSGISPVLLLSKTDLLSEEKVEVVVNELQDRIRDVPVVAFSNETGAGTEAIRSLMEKGRTCCILGSSGVGKSTLINTLAGSTLMKTGDISGHTGKGKHVTTHRQLILLEGGGILIDTPGMREVGIGDAGSGIGTTFDVISGYAGQCRYRDCTHTGEDGCAVMKAVESGEIDRDSYDNYLKLEKEHAHYESTVAERRKKEKAFGKVLKNYKKDMKKNRS